MEPKAIFDGWASAYNTIQTPENEDVGRSNEDIEFYRQEAEKTGGRILEIGCGTGRIYLPLLENGNDVTGLDLSIEQLEILETNAKENGLDPSTHHGDMRDFTIDSEFDLIIVPFNAFLHNITSQEQLQCLDAIKEHLSENGKVIVDFAFPGHDLEPEEYVITSEFTRDDSEFFLVEQFETRGVEQILDIRRRLYKDGELKGKVSYEYARIYKREFEHLLHRAGFTNWNLYGDFDHQPLEAISQTMVWEIQSPK